MQDSEQKWQLELWENENGFCPVGDFFNELETKKNFEYNRMIKKLNWFRTHSLSILEKRGDLSKVKNEYCWELRFSVGIEIRFLGIIKEDKALQIFLVTHGFHKKDQKIRKSDIEIARKRIKQIL